MPRASMYDPSLHAEHAASEGEPGALVVPAGHCLQESALDAPTTALNVPAGQAAHAVLAASAANVPTGHSMQPGEPAAGAALPGGHNLHAGASLVSL